MKALEKRNIKKLTILLISCVFYLNAHGQFYNGSKCPLAKTKFSTTISTGNSTGSTILTATLTSTEGISLNITADYATKKLAEIENFFDYTIEKRMIFIIFNKNSEYRQSNIGLVTFDENSYNTGGFNRIIKNKVMLYYEGARRATNSPTAASTHAWSTPFCVSSGVRATTVERFCIALTTVARACLSAPVRASTP